MPSAIVPPVIGRFAPTPSGPLHFGSLVTALASYCQSKSQQGKWLLRIEDVDTPRNVKHAASQICRDLELFGFQWDGEIEYQSQQFEYYESIIQSLVDQQFGYFCGCSRRYLKSIPVAQSEFGLIYPGLCRDKKLNREQHSIRINTQSAGMQKFDDLLFGNTSLHIEEQVGDFTLKRVDGIYAYHLAVVLDDARQNINQIVRGADLLKITCLHLYLQQTLNLPTPLYLHIPLVLNQHGDKLSKQFGAEALDMNQKSQLLSRALHFLGQQISTDSELLPVEDILQHAIENWDLKGLHITRQNHNHVENSLRGKSDSVIA